MSLIRKKKKPAKLKIFPASIPSAQDVRSLAGFIQSTYASLDTTFLRELVIAILEQRTCLQSEIILGVHANDINSKSRVVADSARIIFDGLLAQGFRIDLLCNTGRQLLPVTYKGKSYTSWDFEAIKISWIEAS